MGCGVQTHRLVLRVAAAYLAVFVAILIAFALGAFAFVARIDRETLQPVIDLPEGAAAYRAALEHAALAIGAVAAALFVVVSVASYLLAEIATRPLREARERERQFAVDAAHELRTPLARIAGVAQAAQLGDADPRERALVTVTDMALEASVLIGDLLTLARVEHIPPAIAEPVDLTALARDVAATLPARGDVRIAVTGMEGAFVHGDVLRLRRLLANLLENALRHARSNVRLDVRFNAPRTIVVEVDDDGPGVAPQVRERIFERFVTGAEGTGLGLPICRWIARAHGGDVRYVEGARFVVDLPALDPAGTAI